MTGKDIKRLFLAHGREVQSFLTGKLRDADTAADLTQETFLRFAEQGALVLRERSYLLRTAHNLAVDHIRRQRRENTEYLDDDGLDALAADAPSPEQTVVDRDELRRMRGALAELPERTQRIFLAVRVRGQGYRQVAHQLGVSESSVQKHLARALKHLMQRMRENGPA